MDHSNEMTNRRAEMIRNTDPSLSRLFDGLPETQARRRPAGAGSTDAEAYGRLRWAVMETLSAAAIHEAETPGPLQRRLAELEEVFSSLPVRERP